MLWFGVAVCVLGLVQGWLRVYFHWFNIVFIFCTWLSNVIGWFRVGLVRVVLWFVGFVSGRLRVG